MNLAPLPSPRVWAEAMAELTKHGLTVLPNYATKTLAIAPAGTTFRQVPTGQWRPGLDHWQVVAIAHDPALRAAYLSRPWSLGWLDQQQRRRQHHASPPAPPADLADPWSDAPIDAPGDAPMDR